MDRFKEIEKELKELIESEEVTSGFRVIRVATWPFFDKLQEMHGSLKNEGTLRAMPVEEEQRLLVQYAINKMADAGWNYFGAMQAWGLDLWIFSKDAEELKYQDLKDVFGFKEKPK